ncbi:protein containing Resolvase, partial [Candidatus Magnetobacterium bavaricum]
MQLRELHLYANDRGWVVTEYIDSGISGVKEKRPALNKMMEDVRSKKINIVLVWKMDRLGRSLKHLLNTINELQTFGTAFVSVKE